MCHTHTHTYKHMEVGRRREKRISVVFFVINDAILQRTWEARASGDGSSATYVTFACRKMRVVDGACHVA